MKRPIYLFIAVLLFCFTGCGPVDPVIASLPQYETMVMYTEGEFQDYTDFGIFTYADTSAVKANTCFSEVGDQQEYILSYIADFKSWVGVLSKNEEPSELTQNYSFDEAALDKTDLYYLNLKDTGFYNYTLYLFDTQTNTLFYFHSNT